MGGVGVFSFGEQIRKKPPYRRAAFGRGFANRWMVGLSYMVKSGSFFFLLFPGSMMMRSFQTWR
jgi:hypothetical protein